MGGADRDGHAHVQRHDQGVAGFEHGPRGSLVSLEVEVISGPHCGSPGAARSV